VSARPPLEAVVFDAGGTLIRLDFEWMVEDLAAHGVTTDPATLRRAEVQGRRAYDASSRPAAPVSSPPIGVRGDVRAYFRGTLEAASVPGAMIGPSIERFLAREKERGLWVRPMEGAREAVDAVRAMGLRTAVVSNSDGRAESHLVNTDMLRGIEFVIDSQLVGVEKPDPRIFGFALSRLGIAPERGLYVGDIRSVDEAGSRAAGMRFVLIDPLGDYGAPGVPRIAGMTLLASWVADAFEVVRASGGAATPAPATERESR
jgi:HAD superfamily hydrolase (TIGR01509 family)